MKVLDETVLVDPVTHVNFFNGRLLTAEDLRTERKALARRDRQLTRGVGTGVVEGLWVESLGASTPHVRISPGLALTPRGDVLELPATLELTLGRRDETTVVRGPDFEACDRAATGEILSARGVYLLVVAPVEALSTDRAPRAGLGTDGRAYGCEARYVYHGLVFRLVKVELVEGSFPELTAEVLTTLRAGEGATGAPASLRRNLLAHFFLGTLSRRLLAGQLFTRDLGGSPLRSYGPIDELRRRGVLADCDIPLAVVSWLGTRVDFIDGWAARRSVGRPAPSRDWPVPGDDRGRREREAAFLQFQRQLADLATASGGLGGLRMRDHFRYLPSVSYLPIEAEASPGTVVPFLDGTTYRAPTFADSAVLDELQRDSTDFEPIDLGAGEMVWLYVPWQLAQAADQDRVVSPVLVVAGPHLAERGVARFDVARWDYSNYAR